MFGRLLQEPVYNSIDVVIFEPMPLEEYEARYPFLRSWTQEPIHLLSGQLQHHCRRIEEQQLQCNLP
jgi:hypothetical protein